MENAHGESLIRLLDDPDPLVFEAVSRKILQLGPELLPDLESVAIDTLSPVLHEHVEHLIRILQFDMLKKDLKTWIYSPIPQLAEGAWLMTRFQFPDLTLPEFMKLMKPLRDEIWLEISETLTALEKVRIMNTLLFDKDRLIINEDHPDSPGNNYINRVLETGKANEHSMNLLYAVIGQDLGMQLYMVEMPDYPILSYVDVPVLPGETVDPALFDVLFYINPADSGTVHSRNDITNFLLSQSLPLDPTYYNPRTNPDFIQTCLNRLALDYKLSGSEIRSSQIQDLLTLWK